MRRLNNLITFFSAVFAFFFGCFISTTLTNIEKCATGKSSRLANIEEDHRNAGGSIFLLILILTAPNYFERRDTIRDTWLQLGHIVTHEYFPEDFVYVPDYNENGFLEMETVQEQQHRLELFKDWVKNDHGSDSGDRRKVNTKHMFVVGTKNIGKTMMKELEREQKVNRDLLFLPELQDSYSNLTQKMLQTIDRVVKEYKFRYILKTDDDTYVKLEYLLNELLSYDRKLIGKAKEYYRKQPMPELYWGFFNGRAQIKSRGQWKETNFHLCNNYLPYALGGGYVISHGLADYVRMNAKILSTFVSEDISFGTWLSPLRNVYKRHDTRFDTGWMPRKCSPYHLVLHKRNSDQMKDLFEQQLCTFEATNEKDVKRPAEYFYDWNSNAENCCDNLV